MLEHAGQTDEVLQTTLVRLFASAVLRAPVCNNQQDTIWVLPNLPGIIGTLHHNLTGAALDDIGTTHKASI